MNTCPIEHPIPTASSLSGVSKKFVLPCIKIEPNLEKSFFQTKAIILLTRIN